jgi:hypothetical protein
VDAVLELARTSGLAIALGIFHQLHPPRVNLDNARAWAAWVAARYGHLPNLIWSMYPKAEADQAPICRELAAGLREGDTGHHLITVHPDPSPTSSRFLHAEHWLDFNCIQTFKDTHLIGPMVTHDYHLEPAKPAVMAEGAYEAGTEYGFEVTPLWIRRQAYWSYLSGGHHSYGHNDAWRLPPMWHRFLDAPGAAQMRILREVFEARPAWWNLAADQSLIASSEEGDPGMHFAARSAAGDWGLVYLGDKGTVAVRADVAVTEGAVRATWIDPTTGKQTPAGALAAGRPRSFATPPGWEDAVLVLEGGSAA